MSSEVGDEVIMMSIEEGSYFGLKGPSGRIWELLKDGSDLQQIHSDLVSEYEVDPSECERELFALIGDMLQNNLIEPN